MYSIQALWTAAQRKLPLTVVVINNSGYGAMRSFSQVMQVRNVPGLELPGIDFVKIAQGMGCDAVRVSKAAELAPALKRGLAHDGVSLIEVMVDSAVPLLYAQKRLSAWMIANSVHFPYTSSRIFAWIFAMPPIQRS